MKVDLKGYDKFVIEAENGSVTLTHDEVRFLAQTLRDGGARVLGTREYYAAFKAYWDKEKEVWAEYKRTGDMDAYRQWRKDNCGNLPSLSDPKWRELQPA